MTECTAGLLDHTYRLLADRREHMTLREIADGSGLGYDWLSKFANRAIPNPGVINVQTLHDFLARQQQAA